MESSSEGSDSYRQIFWILLDTTSSVSTELIVASLSVLFLLVASAMVSGSEVAFFSLSKKDLDALKETDDKSSKRVLGLLKKPRYLLATILITNNFVNIGIVIATYFITSRIIPDTILPAWKFVIEIVAVTFVLVVFGELMPKVYATQNNLRLSRIMAPLLQFLMGLFRGPGYILVSFSDIVEKRLEKNRKENPDELNPYELEQAIEMTAEEGTSEEEIKMLKGFVKFGNINVKQIMKPRIDMRALDYNANFDNLLENVREWGYSRIPVYKESLDNIEGILYVKDMLEFLDRKNGFKWQELLRDPFYVPESKKIDDLMKEMQEERVHLAIAVDEYGGTSGLITLEDILEEVIGDIKDEYDTTAEIEFRKIDDHNFVFEGKTMLNDICKVLDIREEIFDEVRGDSDSLAGLLLELAEKIPHKGEEIQFGPYLFTVTSVSKNRVQRVKVTIMEDVEPEQLT